MCQISRVDHNNYRCSPRLNHCAFRRFYSSVLHNNFFEISQAMLFIGDDDSNVVLALLTNIILVFS